MIGCKLCPVLSVTNLFVGVTIPFAELNCKTIKPKHKANVPATILTTSSREM